MHLMQSLYQLIYTLVPKTYCLSVSTSDLQSHLSYVAQSAWTSLENLCDSLSAGLYPALPLVVPLRVRGLLEEEPSCEINQ